ncbi:MAG: hypothetical protein Q9207_003796 [Kuettlingeria erythrocarpa]
MSTDSKATVNKTGELDEVDKRLKRLKDNILPDTPYLMDLTTPSRYHVSPHQANNWRKGSSFNKHEEQLQYMTFLPHTARGDTMLRTSGNWDDGDGKIKTEPSKPMSSGSSGAISPSGQQPKKKISLLDYKNKMAGQASGKVSPKAEYNEKLKSNLPLPRSTTVTKPTLKEEAPVRATQTTDSASQRPRNDAPHGLKRSADTMTGANNDAKIFGIPPASPPAKKHQTEGSKLGKDTALKSEKGNIHGLPRMLSPTLPANVEEQLAQLRGGSARSNGESKAAKATGNRVKPTANVASISSKDQNILDIRGSNRGLEKTAKSNLVSKPPTAASTPSAAGLSRMAGRKERNQSASDESSRKETAAALERSNDEPKSKGRERPSGDLCTMASQEEQPRLVVRLKIPKSLRKNCQRILQMQPRPRKLLAQSQKANSPAALDRSRDRAPSNGSIPWEVQQSKIINGDSNRGRSDTVSKRQVVANGAGTPMSGEKRRQADGDKAPSRTSSKRQRLSGVDLQRPSTPAAAATLQSPNAPQPGSSQKSQLSTPKNNLKSAAMQRVGSTEGEAKTPLGNTPTAPGSAERSINGSSSNGSSASSDEGAFYKREFIRYAEMAKSLKHAADALVKSQSGGIISDTVARQEGMAIAIETTLCYMLAFTLKDESDRIKRLPSDRTAWISLPPYFKFVKSLLRSNESPHIQGFLFQLEAVCRNTIFQLDLERLEREATSTDEGCASFRKQLSENAKLATQCWIEGSNFLPPIEIQARFPMTWGQRTTAPISSGRERLIPKHYGDVGYHLPLSSTSSAIEAVRAGRNFLTEWCEQEHIKWELTVDI